tara:strand:+ start:553 stop:954 length:402 start_codon:yes stop_codon:yes gene_type:complete
MSGLVGQVGARSGVLGSTTDSTQLDYEEGTWTPSVTSGISGTPNSYAGTYTKIGNVVSVDFRIGGTGMDVASYATLGGLPFTEANNKGSGWYILDGISIEGGQILVTGSTWYLGAQGSSGTTTAYRGSFTYFT